MLAQVIGAILLLITPLDGKEDDHHKDGFASATISNPVLQRTVAGMSQPVYFDTDLVEPFNIKHPYQNDDSQFCVKREGAYLIGWKMNLINPSQDIVTLAIRDMSTNTLIAHTALTVPVHETVASSAQFILPLAKGAVIKLNIDSQNGNTLLANPVFYITRVGQQ